MRDLLEKGFFAGVGALMYLEEKADEVVGEMIDKGRMAPEEGRRFIEDLDRRLREEFPKAGKRVDESMKNALRDAGFVTKDEIHAISETLTEISARLKSIEEMSATADSEKVDLEP